MNLPERYPAYGADVIQSVVTVAHFDLNKLKVWIEAHPQLVKAAWDWGFGDWETPLGAACHMGRRDIADYLLGKGATPSLFSWVLLGDLPMVRTIVEQQAGVERVAGPHSISLLAHARMAGKPAEAVFRYLTSLRDADMRKPEPLGEAERKSLCGRYGFGGGSSQVVDIDDDVSSYEKSPMYTYAPQLNWTRPGTMGRPLFHLGGGVFFPAGAPSVEVRLESHSGAGRMTIRDGEMLLVGERVPAGA